MYFTPPEVVHAQVLLVEDVLRARLGCASAFDDDRVAIVDPATGSGAYPLAILERAPRAASRMWLFETQPGAVALARSQGLPVREADALRCDVELDALIMVCIGNPPYRRHTASAIQRASLADLADVHDGVHRKNLYNDYVYFWSWALRTTCDVRQGAAIVCLVTAASYLRGPAFGGLRRRLRSTFDEVWLVDLEGDQRAARASNNVFAIRTPIAIALGVRYANTSKTAPAGVHYTRLGGRASDKLERLSRLRGLSDLDWREAEPIGTGPLVPVRRSVYATWPALTELFPWQLSGAQLKRTWPIGVSPDVLRTRWRRLLELPPDDRRRAFLATRDRDVTSSPPHLLAPEERLKPLAELPDDVACPEPVRYAYRPFDRHWVIPDARVGDFMRPALWQIDGPDQLFLTSMLTNVLGPGPAAVVTRLVPDLDHFRGSFGARGVIPLWCDPAATRPNVAPRWLARLSGSSGVEISPRELLTYCYALLAAPSYTLRFEEELRTPGPRVPLTRDAAAFRECAALGEALVRLHTYAAVPTGRAHVVQPVRVYPSAYVYHAHREQLEVGDGVIGPISAAVWAYAVSGYRVLNGWLRRRIGRAGRSILDTIAPAHWSDELNDELLQLIWLIEATLAQHASLDAMLDHVIASELVLEQIDVDVE